MILTPVEALVGVGMNAVTRRFEFQADKFAIDLQTMLAARPDIKPEELKGMEDMGDRLGRALITLHVKNLSTVWVDWMCVLSSLRFRFGRKA